MPNMTPQGRLEAFYMEVSKSPTSVPYIEGEAYRLIEAVSRCLSNRAPVRFLLSCLLAKIDMPHVDIRKPYTEIEGPDTYSGRHYDEKYIEPLIIQYGLPCNSTTAYLTPAFRNHDRILDTSMHLVGRPKLVYQQTLEILSFVHQGLLAPEATLKEIFRQLYLMKSEQDKRLQQLLAELKSRGDDEQLSAEAIVSLLAQHLACKGSSRLPVLMVSAVYQSIGEHIGEMARHLHAHNAADKQTGAMGDLEIISLQNGALLTCYEMKYRAVSIGDIDLALRKVAAADQAVDHYVFVTTERVAEAVAEYARQAHEHSGIEIAIFDCLTFVRHFLHFFYRWRGPFLNHYQALVLNEPASAVSDALKEAFLALRRAAESDPA